MQRFVQKERDVTLKQGTTNAMCNTLSETKWKRNAQNPRY